VQVSETTTLGGAAAARKDEARGPLQGAGDAVRHRAGPSRFREALKRAAADELGPGAAAALGPCGSGAPAPIRVAPPPSKATAPTAAAPAARVDRVLVGSVGGEAEARIRIGAGALAGAEIRLTAVAGSAAVTAQLLTPGAGSRQTLSVAMEELRLRLRDKGIALAASVTRGRPADDARREGGGEQDASGGWSAGR
jgi:hypothetical protein